LRSAAASARSRQDAFEAKPHRSRVTGKRQFDRFARQGLGFVIEQDRRGQRLVVARSCRPASGIFRPAPHERPPAGVSPTQSDPSPLHPPIIRLKMVVSMDCDFVFFKVAHIAILAIPSD
jgi:hypothetical protein